MKIRTLFLSIFALAAFAGVANAQRVVVFSGSDGALLSPSSAATAPQSGPNVNAFSGQTVRIRIEAADASSASFVFGYPLTASACMQGGLFTAPLFGTTVQGRLVVGTDQGVFDLPTDPNWKNGCRILSVRLRDGSEHIGRIFFY